MREKLKNALIIILILSAVVLGWQSRLFGNTSGDLNVLTSFLAGRAGAPPDPDRAAAETQTREAARPITAAATNGAGLHYGARYDMQALDALYERSVLAMSEAFDTAAPPYKIDEYAWRKALLSQGIYFEYLTPVKISVLAGWLGTEITADWGEMETRRLCVGGIVRLFFQQSGTGHFFAANTSVDDSLEQVTEALDVNSAVFAFEVDGAPAPRDPYALLMPDVTLHRVVYADNPLDDEAVVSRALEDLGITDQLSYPDPDGSGAKTYIDNEFTLKFNPVDGTAIFRLRETGGQPGKPLTEGEIIETARRAVAGTIARYCGDAVVCYESISADSDGGYKVRFRYIVAGGVVQLYRDGAAAVVTVRGGKVTEMTLRYRSYSVSDEQEALMPELQVSAASDGPFVLCYPDSGGSWVRLGPCWVHRWAEPED
jgi:hypothetical protein